MDNLLRLLSENARLTTAQIAVMLNKSEQEVAGAIAEYEKAGVIKGYKALIDWDKVTDSHAAALIELKVTPKRESGFDEIAQRVMQFDEVESVYLMAGAYVLAVMVRGKSIQDFAMFVAKRLSPMDSVISTATHFVLSRYKDGGVILCNEGENEERRNMEL
jgi:DNA-binding Lrp family transcriptional regulator